MKRGSVLNRVADRYLGITFLFATGLAARKRKLPASIKHIGLTASPTMGDTLLTSAAILDLRAAYPEAKFFFFAAPAAAGAAELLPCIDEIIPIKITDPRGTVRAFRRAKLDLLVDFTPWQRITAFFSAYSGARYRVGFRTKGQHRHWHFDTTTPHLHTVHEVENFRALVRALGAPTTHQPMLRTPWAESMDEPFPGEETIVLHAWASSESHSIREWPQSKWVALAQQIARPGTRFILTGGPTQRARSEAFCSALQEAGLQATVFEGAQGLRSLVVLLRHASLLVSVNTGVMHLGALLGTPIVALNGPTNPRRWGPWGPPEQCISVEPDGGGGGFLHLGFEFRGNPTDSMQRTQVEDAAKAAERLRRFPSVDD